MSVYLLHGVQTGRVSIEECRTIIAEAELNCAGTIDELMESPQPGVVAELTTPEDEVIDEFVAAAGAIGRRALALADRQNYSWNAISELQGMENVWVVRYSHPMTAYSALRVYLSVYCNGVRSVAGTRMVIDEARDRF